MQDRPATCCAVTASLLVSRRETVCDCSASKAAPMLALAEGPAALILRISRPFVSCGNAPGVARMRAGFMLAGRVSENSRVPDVRARMLICWNSGEPVEIRTMVPPAESGMSLSRLCSSAKFGAIAAINPAMESPVSCPSSISAWSSSGTENSGRAERLRERSGISPPRSRVGLPVRRAPSCSGSMLPPAFSVRGREPDASSYLAVISSDRSATTSQQNFSSPAFGAAAGVETVTSSVR